MVKKEFFKEVFRDVSNDGDVDEKISKINNAMEELDEVYNVLEKYGEFIETDEGFEFSERKNEWEEK